LIIPIEILWGIAAFLSVKIFESIWNLIKKQSELKDQTVKENTLAILDLSVQIKILQEKIAHLPKMAQDINEASVKIRQIQKMVGFSDTEGD